MISELARMFSSQGVLIQGTQYSTAPRRKPPVQDPSDLKNPAESFAAKFDQAAFKLELSKQGAGKQLTEEQQKQVAEMAKRDREVHTHEQAHMARGAGSVQGGPKFEYTTGPDGQQYAVGGHVNIDVSPVAGSPQASLQKAQTVQSAALAPEDPSGQDRAVANAAMKMAADARAKIADNQAGKLNPESANQDKFQQARSAYARPSATNGRSFAATA
jgi:hypothetical protein